MRKLRKMIYKEIRGPHELSNVGGAVERVRSTELHTSHTCKPNSNPCEWAHDFDEIDFVSCLDQKLHLNAMDKPRDVATEIATGFLSVDNLRNMQDGLRVIGFVIFEGDISVRINFVENNSFHLCRSRHILHVKTKKRFQ